MFSVCGIRAKNKTMGSCLTGIELAIAVRAHLIERVMDAVVHSVLLGVDNNDDFVALPGTHSRRTDLS
jgi:hypothetical protein